MGAAVELGYEYKVIGMIRLTDAGDLALGGDRATLTWWIARLQGKRSNEEFVRTLPGRLNSLLWARRVQEQQPPA